MYCYGDNARVLVLFVVLTIENVVGRMAKTQNILSKIPRLWALPLHRKVGKFLSCFPKFRPLIS